jgi:hypothetical protein
MRALVGVLVVASQLVACSSNGTSAVSGTGGAGGGTGPGSGSGSGSGGEAGSGGAGTGGAGLPYPFRYGVNMGHANAAWGDDLEATLCAHAGARSIRVKLPASHLKTWGYDIEVGDVKTYDSLAMKNHIGFLIGSETLDKSIAPAGSQDWENEYYIPKNLYQPTLGADGKINPENYWASYVYNTVSTYKTWIHVWHVWNEPDWTPSYDATKTWATDAPKAADLPRFNGSIHDYIRMLRITKEAATKADPEALIATGGIGYPTFLAALLRYTDNPDGGAVTLDYPLTGGAYFDVLDYHYYPLFGPKSSDAGADGFVALKSAMADELGKAGKTVRGWNVSETGAPMAMTTDNTDFGSPAYARNYLVKVMTRAQAAGIGGVDWFIASNGDAASTSAFGRMGLYEDLSPLGTIDQAKKTETGVAYTTLQNTLGGAIYDDAATKALVLPKAVRAVAFRQASQRRIALWAVTPAAAEDASASVDVPTTSGFDVIAWDGSKTAADANAGVATVAVTGAPVLLVEH